MLAVPIEVAGSLGVENQAVRRLVVLPHAASDVVAFSDVIAETKSIVAEKDA